MATNRDDASVMIGRGGAAPRCLLEAAFRYESAPPPLSDCDPTCAHGEEHNKDRAMR